MSAYTLSPSRPINEPSCSTSAIAVRDLLHQLQRSGRDGKDVALGTLRALREFIRYNVGSEGVQAEVERLAPELLRHE